MHDWRGGGGLFCHSITKTATHPPIDGRGVAVEHVGQVVSANGYPVYSYSCVPPTVMSLEWVCIQEVMPLLPPRPPGPPPFIRK